MSRIKVLLVFALISFLIGSMGLYTIYLQTFAGSGADKCASRECWGDYPTHLIRWLTLMTPVFTVFFLALPIVIDKFFKKKVNYRILIAPTAGFIYFAIYIAAAYFKKIDILANVLFPTRTFWAGNLFLLLIGAAAFGLFQKSQPKYSQFVSIFACLLILLTIIQKPPQIHKDFTATFPQFVERYAIPKFKSRELSEVVPDWVLALDINWRLDINNSGLNQWFYLISEIPITTGYSNRPTGVHQNWQYFLQASTRQIPPESDNELAKNKALFLIDAFGIRAFEMSQATYPNSILNDQTITKAPTAQDHFWRQISEKFTSPIVYPTNSEPVLFVGTDAAYNYFIRSIAMTNINSEILIPVKGPDSIKSLSQSELKVFKNLFIYGFSDSLSSLTKLGEYVKDGGKIFIDTASVAKSPGKSPEILPVNKLTIQELNSNEQSFDLKTQELAQNLEIKGFSALTAKTGLWRITFAPTGSLKKWARPVLTYQGKLIMAQGQLGKGYVIWSGLNLPFHITENNNFNEAKLLKNTLLQSAQKTDNSPFSVQRVSPKKITVTGTFKGIYFKENYDSGWIARNIDKKLKIYKAGLDFMYVPITTSNPTNLEINLTYQGNFTGKLLFTLTIFSTILTIMYLIIPSFLQFLSAKIISFAHKKVIRKVSKFLEDEEKPT